MRSFRVNTLSLALASLFAAGAASGADLLQIYQEALGYDAQYGSARAAYYAGVERVPQARALLRPSVNLNANAAFIASKREGFERSSGGTAGYTLSLAQPIYNPQNDIQLEQAEVSLTQNEAQLEQALQDLIIRVSQAYFDVLLAQDNLAVARSQKTAISEQLAQAKRNFEVGTSTITDTHEAQARYDLAVSQEISDQNNLEIRRRALEQLIGHRPGELATLNINVKLPLPTPNNMEEWVKTSERQNPQVVAAQAARDIAAKDIDRNRAAYKPELDFVASFGGTGYSKNELGQDLHSGQVGVQLNWQLWEGGLRASQVREAIANAERGLQDLENARRSVALSARQNFLAVTNGVSQVRALEQALVSTQSALDSTRLGQEVGVRTSIDVLNAQQQLFQSRRDLYAARYNTLLSQLRLKQATGLLSQNDVAEVNKNLQEPRASTPVPNARPPVPARPLPGSPGAATPGAPKPRTGPPASSPPRITPAPQPRPRPRPQP